MQSPRGKELLEKEKEKGSEEKGSEEEMKPKKIKKKPTKMKDGSWDTSDLYRSGGNPFDMEWIKFFNSVEGRDQILFLYTDKETKKIVKHRILR